MPLTNFPGQFTNVTRNIPPTSPSNVPAMAYMRVPTTARGQQLYGSSGALTSPTSPVFVPTLGPPNTDFGANVARTNMNFGAVSGQQRMASPKQNNTSNINLASNSVDKNSIYSQLGRNRNNIRPNVAPNSQYITIGQNDLGRSGLGTHI